MLLVSVVKGAWTEDVDKLQRERGITMGYWTSRVAGTSDDRGRRGGTSKIGGGKRIGGGAGAGASRRLEEVLIAVRLKTIAHNMGMHCQTVMNFIIN